MPKALIQPAGGQAARRHFTHTIERPVPLEQLRSYLSADDFAALEHIYPVEQVPTWGITPGKGDVNVSTWEQIEPGDVALFVGGGQVFASGLITFKTTNVELAASLWDTDEEGQTWQYLYFLDRIQRHAMPYAEFNQAAGYKQGFIPRGAIVLKEPRSTARPAGPKRAGTRTGPSRGRWPADNAASWGASRAGTPGVCGRAGHHQ